MKSKSDPVDLEPVEAAAREALSWSARSIEERAAIFTRVPSELARHRQELVEMVACDTGKPVSLEDTEIHRSVALIETAIVWPDADLDEAATKIATGAFAFAGQRCTANRRVIVHASCHDDFLARLVLATRRLPWGDPYEPATRIGPLVSVAAADRGRDLVDRVHRAGHAVIVPHEETTVGAGAFFPATIIVCHDAAHAIVQEESFGPILVVQRARLG